MANWQKVRCEMSNARAYEDAISNIDTLGTL